MINFTVGPVQSSETVRSIGAENCPYFRTPEFSAVMLENEQLMLEFAHAPDGARAVFMTCSGTGSMEATIMNVLNPSDCALVVNGGELKDKIFRVGHVGALTTEDNDKLVAALKEVSGGAR